jgi:hypothetical protein
MTINKKKKKPLLVIKILMGGIPIALVIIWFAYLRISGAKMKKLFYDSSFAAIVVKSDYYYQRTMEFHLSNGLKLYFSPSDTTSVMIGDSIKKTSNTFIYDVYRKDLNGRYHFLGTYHFVNGRMAIYDNGK